MSVVAGVLALPHSVRMEFGSVFRLVLVLVFGLAGCSSTDSGPCGEGGVYDDGQAAAYCSYIVIVGGFECPASFENLLELEGGSICASEPVELDDVPVEVCRRFSSGCTPKAEDVDGAIVDSAVEDAAVQDSGTDPDANLRSCSGLGDGIELILELPNGGVYTQGELAAGVDFSVQLSVSNALVGVLPVAQDSGGCGEDQMGGLIYFVEVSGNDQQYCLCDVGNCGGLGIDPVDVEVGNYAAVFSWDGSSWIGPSDFNNPKGESFSPGQYTARASIKYKPEPDAEAVTEVVVECPVTVVE